MSRQTKFDLKFPTGITCRISLHKSSEATTGFCQGFEGRQVRTVKVLSTDDAAPASKDDIEKLVAWGDLETYFPYKDETGEMKLMPIDKKAMQAMFKNSNTMAVQGLIDKDAIKPHMFDDSHYFVNVQRDTKTKAIFAPDQKVYTIMYHFLNERNKYLLIKFISSSREKFGVIYSDPESLGLRMSLIIHSTYQRERAVENLTEITDAVSYGEKLFKGLGLRAVDPSIIIDDYEEKVRAYIDEYKRGGTEGKKPTIVISGAPKTTEVDILDLISAM